MGMGLGFYASFGVVMMLAFLASMLAARLKQSAIVGYILVGLVASPFVLGSALAERGIQWIDTDAIRQMASIGILFLLFFIGLEFSPDKLKRAGKAAVILALSDIAINFFIGFIIGYLFGWPMVDILFLAGIISMNSLGLAAKSLNELGRLNSYETEFLISTMVMGDLISISLLAIANFLGVGIEAGGGLGNAIMMPILVYAALFGLAVLVVPRIAVYVGKIRSEEQFILFALAVIFLAAAFAEFGGINGMMGAFLIGMAFSETRVAKRLDEHTSSMRDAFVAVFFVSFGMMINPSLFPSVALMIAFAVPLVVMNEIMIIASLAYFIGFKGRSAVSLGASMLSRAEDAVIYASVGASLKTPKGAQVVQNASALYPFAGAFTLIMSLLTPIFMRASRKIADFFDESLPDFMTYAANLVSRTLKYAVMPSDVPKKASNHPISIGMVLYVILIFATITTTFINHIIVSASCVVLLAILWLLIDNHLKSTFTRPHFSELQLPPSDINSFLGFVTNMIIGSLFTVFLIAALWQYLVLWTVLLLPVYVAFVVSNMDYIYRKVKKKIKMKPARIVAFDY